MQIENVLDMRAAAASVLSLAAAVEQWPRLLPHYRAVRDLAQRPEGRLVEMSAYRAGIPFPVHWRALQRVDAPSGRILYRHVGGVTRGMEVEWRIEPSADGVRVTIVHEFSPPWPWPGALIARYIVCLFFVHAIADATLAGIKKAAEEPATDTPAACSLPEHIGGGPERRNSNGSSHTQ